MGDRAHPGLQGDVRELEGSAPKQRRADAFKRLRSSFRWDRQRFAKRIFTIDWRVELTFKDSESRDAPGPYGAGVGLTG